MTNNFSTKFNIREARCISYALPLVLKNEKYTYNLGAMLNSFDADKNGKLNATELSGGIKDSMNLFSSPFIKEKDITSNVQKLLGKENEIDINVIIEKCKSYGLDINSVSLEDINNIFKELDYTNQKLDKALQDKTLSSKLEVYTEIISKISKYLDEDLKKKTVSELLCMIDSNDSKMIESDESINGLQQAFPKFAKALESNEIKALIKKLQNSQGDLDNEAVKKAFKDFGYDIDRITIEEVLDKLNSLNIVCNTDSGASAIDNASTIKTQWENDKKGAIENAYIVIKKLAETGSENPATRGLINEASNIAAHKIGNEVKESLGGNWLANIAGDITTGAIKKTYDVRLFIADYQNSNNKGKFLWNRFKGGVEHEYNKVKHKVSKGVDGIKYEYNKCVDGIKYEYNKLDRTWVKFKNLF